LEENIFDKIWVQPAAGDAGGALGCALYMTYTKGGLKRIVNAQDSQQGSYLGNSYTDEDVAEFVGSRGLTAHRCEDVSKTCQITAGFLAENKIVGWFRGRMEFGPRALGNRSIIALPLSQEMQSKINLRIKFRESFRPFAPSVLAEKENEYFDLKQDSPYMLLVGHVNPDRCKPFDKKKLLEESGGNMIPVVNVARSDIPAVTHLDYSARVQTVDRDRNPDYYQLISEFEKLTGCGVIVNTSFNVRGEPIVCSIEDAYRCFMRTDMDVLVVENWVFIKEEQPALEGDSDWRSEYELD
jgi:carbamoyltransferase